MANFIDVVNEIKGRAGESRLTFSRTDFDKLMKAYVNDVNYEADVYANGETTKIKPVKAFRGMLKAVLEDFGVDKQEAERVMDEAYQIRKVDGMYELCSEVIYGYVEAGKKFSFIDKADFTGSLFLTEVEESEKVSRGIKDQSISYKVKKGKHKKMGAESSCPKWLKSSVQI